MSYVSFGRRQIETKYFCGLFERGPGATSFSHCGPYTDCVWHHWF